jgi:Zn-dependent M28 family amino/carboxypeptidase
MMRQLVLFFVSSIIAIAAHPQAQSQTQFDGKSWWDYVKVLADDKMEGRETGSEGLRKAEAYVVDRIQAAGLEPAGTDGFYQSVKFRSRQIVESDSSAALVRNGKAKKLKLGEDAFFSTRVDLAPEVSAPLVFVGYGLSIPEKNYDDFKDLDLADKVAVIFTGSPADIPGALASHAQTAGERWKALHQAGAIGVITLPNPAAMDIPWARMRLSRTRPTMSLADPQFDETAGEKLALVFNPAKAEALFAGSGHKFKEIVKLGKDRKPLPRFPLAVTIQAKTRTETNELESSNVIARLTGSDPQLKNDYVVLTAHIDHLGIGEPINGDRIYNGAMDNASGSAVLLDVASSLKKSPAPLKRSLLFVFVTGEEKGLLGSRHFVANPTVSAQSIVADINIDMFLPIVPLKVLTVYGLAESDLGESVRAVAQSLGVGVQPDPEPLRNSFIRSDQYSFIRAGIPALAMKVGFAPGSREQKIFKDWLTQRYHAPSDDVNQPVNLEAAARYEDVIRELMISVANSGQRPQWAPGSFFRRYARSAVE